MQSTNEELTTSKEEMQSMNEELQTVNTELQVKVDELSHASNDMKNLLDSTDIATLFLDKELNVRRFNPAGDENHQAHRGGRGPAHH
jgi:two-component system CheB/CheR fusion protein